MTHNEPTLVRFDIVKGDAKGTVVPMLCEYGSPHKPIPQLNGLQVALGNASYIIFANLCFKDKTGNIFSNSSKYLTLDVFATLSNARIHTIPKDNRRFNAPKVAQMLVSEGTIPVSGTLNLLNRPRVDEDNNLSNTDHFVTSVKLEEINVDTSDITYMYTYKTNEGEWATNDDNCNSRPKYKIPNFDFGDGQVQTSPKPNRLATMKLRQMEAFVASILRLSDGMANMSVNQREVRNTMATKPKQSLQTQISRNQTRYPTGDSKGQKGGSQRIRYKNGSYKIRYSGRHAFIVTKAEGEVTLATVKRWQRQSASTK